MLDASGEINANAAGSNSNSNSNSFSSRSQSQPQSQSQSSNSNSNSGPFARSSSGLLNKDVKFKKVTVGSQSLKKLQAVVKSITLRRTKEVTLKDLPPRNVVLITKPFSPEERVRLALLAPDLTGSSCEYQDFYEALEKQSRLQF